MRHRPPPIDIVCGNCQAVLAREDGQSNWSVKVLDENGEITDRWPEEVWRCWNCDHRGTVNIFRSTIIFPPKTHGRLRVPTRPPV